MTSYGTLTEAISDLRRRDYVLDYNVTANQAYCPALGEGLRLDELIIQETHRFEGDSNPDDSTVLFALQSLKNPAHKGLLVAASSSFISQLRYASPQGS